MSRGCRLMARNTTPRNTACRNASSLVDVRNSHDRELQPSASFHRKRLWTASSFHVKYFLLLAAYMRDYIGRVYFIHTSLRISTTTSLKFFTDRNHLHLSFLFLLGRMEDESYCEVFAKEEGILYLSTR